MLIIHMSDLHFGDYIDKPTFGIRCHDFKILAALSNFITKQTFDRIFITGDVVTGGNANAFQHARDFFYGRINTPGMIIGLNLQEDSDVILAVPGNHDYYPSRIFPIISGVSGYNKYFPTCTTPYVKFVWKNMLKATVFGLDSSKGAKGSIANGKISQKELDWLAQTCDELGQGRHPNSPYSEQDYKDSFKIVLLHHHLYLPKGQKYSLFRKIKNRKEILKTFLKCDIDMIFFGHEHYHFAKYPEYRCQLDKRISRKLARDGYNVKKRLFACMASTAAQAEAEDNSLWELNLSNSSITCQRHYFDNGRFVPSAETINLNLVRTSCKP